MTADRPQEASGRPSARARTMRWMLLLFAVICFILAGNLFFQARDLEARLHTLRTDPQAIERDPYLLRRQLRRTRILVWASAGGGVLLAVSASATTWKRGTSSLAPAQDA